MKKGEVYDTTTNEYMSLERWLQKEYRAACELGYNREACKRILHASSQNEALRIIKQCRKGGDNMNKVDKIVDISKIVDPKVNDIETCFYYDERRKTCMLLKRAYCCDKGEKECSFWLNKDKYVWGKKYYQGHEIKTPVVRG